MGLIGQRAAPGVAEPFRKFAERERLIGQRAATMPGAARGAGRTLCRVLIEHKTIGTA